MLSHVFEVHRMRVEILLESYHHSAHLEFAATVEAASHMSDNSDDVAVIPGSPA
jgi:hypothetical protein